jgi:ketosteroid isomerase-like protein
MLSRWLLLENCALKEVLSMNGPEEVALMQAMEAASARFQSGDVAGMQNLYSDGETVTLFGALGGCAKGRTEVEKILRGAAANLARQRSVRDEVVSLVIEGKLAYCTGVEKIRPAAEGLSDLRVTNIFRRENGAWRLLHRHADAYRESPFA